MLAEKLPHDVQVTMVWLKEKENPMLKKWSKKRTILLYKLKKGNLRTMENVKLVGPEEGHVDYSRNSSGAQ